MNMYSLFAGECSNVYENDFLDNSNIEIANLAVVLFKMKLEVC